MFIFKIIFFDDLRMNTNNINNVKNIRIIKYISTAVAIGVGIATIFSFSSNLVCAQTTQNNDQTENAKIDIIGVANRQIPLQLTQINAPNSFNQDFNENIARTGKIKLLTPEINSNGLYQLSYNLQDMGQGFILKATLKNLSEGKQIMFEQQSQHLDLLANRLSDFIYEHFFEKRGNFSTRLSYITKNNKNEYELLISDSSGRNTVSALKSKSPIISVSWSPDGKRIAYVSFEKQKPSVFIQHLATGTREEVANYSGNNSAPSWHPTGQKLALALSQTGHTQIYELDLQTKQLKRLTASAAPIIDTEPYYSNDGLSIYFTSDRGGAAQIYKMSANGESEKTAARTTFQGEENTSPKISPDGKYMIYISRNNGAYQLHRQSLTTGDIRLISQTYHDESPSFSANGDYVIYATRQQGKNVLIASDIEGQASYRIQAGNSAGQIRQPAWGPFPK